MLLHLVCSTVFFCVTVVHYTSFQLLIDMQVASNLGLLCIVLLRPFLYMSFDEYMYNRLGFPHTLCLMVLPRNVDGRNIQMLCKSLCYKRWSLSPCLCQPSKGNHLGKYSTHNSHICGQDCLQGLTKAKINSHLMFC